MPRMYEDAELPDDIELYDLEDFDTHRKLIFGDAKTALQAISKRAQRCQNGT